MNGYREPKLHDHHFPWIDFALHRDSWWPGTKKLEATRSLRSAAHLLGYNMLCQLFESSWTPETLEVFYEGIDWSKLPTDTNLLRVQFILHPQASPALVRKVSLSYDPESYGMQRIQENALVALLSLRDTPQEYLLHLAKLNIDSTYKCSIVFHPNSDFEVLKAVYLSGTLEPQQEKDFVQLPRFKKSVLAHLLSQGMDIDGLPFEWLLGLWKMSELESRVSA